jgi:ABC-type nitrate/sulfonate/bicarbonate transport system permease component
MMEDRLAPRKRPVSGGMSRLIAMTGLVFVWWLGTTLSRSKGLPTPGGVVGSLIELHKSGILIPAFQLTASRILTGFAIGFLLAFVVGWLVATSSAVRSWLDPWINTFRSVAPFAWIPMAILWFGTGGPAAIFIVAYATFFPVVISVIHGVRSADHRLIRAARSLGSGASMILREVVFPSALPNILVGARLGMGAAWTSVIAAELAVATRSGTQGGLGEQMVITITFRPDLNFLVALMLVVGVIALCLDAMLRWLFRRLVVWP